MRVRVHWVAPATAVLGLLIVLNCGSDSDPTGTSHDPPTSYAGIWEVVDTLFIPCEEPRDYRPALSYTDTICEEHPDFGAAFQECYWDLIFGVYYDIGDCSGDDSGTQIDVECSGSKTVYTPFHEDTCEWIFLFQTEGDLAEDVWTVYRFANYRIICKQRPEDTLRYCQGFKSILTRVGGAPESCP